VVDLLIMTSLIQSKLSFDLAITTHNTANSIISTSIPDGRSETRDSRSAAAKQFEFKLGYIIEDYVANGKDRFDDYIEEHKMHIDDYLAKDGVQRKNDHRVKEITAQRRVWMLLAYLSKSSRKIPEDHERSDENYYFDPASFIRDKFNADYNLRKLENIIKWLEDIAPFPSHLKRGDISYSRTLSQSQNVRNPSLNSLDPDVMSRMQIDRSQLNDDELEDLDDEEQLLHDVFRYIRKGKWKTAVDLCRNYGQHWRAASLNGRALFRDAQSTDNSLHATWGNEEYLMWLRVCNALCQNTESLPEKWIYGALCGNVTALISFVSQQNNSGNWYDYLWTLCVCKQIYVQHQMLCQQLPSYYHNDLKNEALNEDELFKELNIVDPQWEGVLDNFESIFQWIEENKKAFISKQIEAPNACNSKPTESIFGKIGSMLSGNKDDGNNNDGGGNDGEFNTGWFESEYNEQYYQICKYVVCEDPEALLTSCCRFIENERLQKDFVGGITLDFMRFVIHLYLHLNPAIASREHKASIPPNFKSFIGRYISKLIDNGHYDMIARYCFILPKTELIETMTSFLLKLEDTQLRIKLITKAKDVLPPRVIQQISANIAKDVIDRSIEASRNLSEWKERTEPQAMTIEDQHKIDSLRCLKIVNDNYKEILLRANQLFTVFAKEYKVEGIQKLYNDTQEIIRFHQKPHGVAKYHLQGLECHFNTFQCWKEYKLVIDAHDSWQLRWDAMPQQERNTIVGLMTKYLREMLLHQHGWMNPRYCAVQDLPIEAVNEVRKMVLHRLLEMVYQFVDESKEYAFIMEIVTIFAEERTAYYKLFSGREDKQVIKDMLKKAKDAKIEMIRIQQELQRRNGGGM